MPLFSPDRTCPICGYSLEENVEAELGAGLQSERIASEEALMTHFQTVHPEYWNWEESKVRIGLALGIVPAVLTGFGLFYLIAIYLHLPGNWGAIIFIVSLVVFAIPFRLIVHRGAGHYKALWQAEGRTITTAPPMYGTFAEGSASADDSAIKGLTSNLFSQLEIPNLAIRDVKWRTLIPHGKGFDRVPPAGAVIDGDEINLEENLKGKLTASDWTPLIASSLIYERGLGQAKIIRALTVSLPTLAVYIAAWFFVPPLFPTTTTCDSNGVCGWSNLGVLILIFGGIFLVFIPMIFVVGWQVRKLRGVADLKAAKLFGKDTLIQSLQRVVQASPSETYALQKRISRLQKLN